VTSDEELIRHVRDGDGTAFERLAERYYPICLRFAERHLGQLDDAEDAVQEAMVRAFRALENGASPEAFRPWLLGIVVNRCRSIIARRRRRRLLLETWLSRWDPGQQVVPPPELDGGLDPRVRKALGSLSPKLREAFLLRHVEELSYADISRATGTSLSALKMRVKRASEQLMTALSEEP